MSRAAPAFVLVLVIHALLAPPARADNHEASLFFLPEEVIAILESRRMIGTLPSEEEMAITGEEAGKAGVEPTGARGNGEVRPPPQLPRYIHLSAILQRADGVFDVWLNGNIYSQLGGNDLWQIVKVLDDRVLLRLQQGEYVGRIVEIGINQTYDLGTARSIEGRPSSPADRLATIPPRIR